MTNASKVTKKSCPNVRPSPWLGFLRYGIHPGGIASGLLRCTSSRCVRLRRTVAALPPPDKSLHSACRRGLWIKIKSFRRADTRPLSGAASPRAVHTVKNCGSQPVGDGGLTADQFPTDHPQSNCGSGLAREGGLIAEQSPTECTPSNCRSEPAREEAYQATSLSRPHPNDRSHTAAWKRSSIMTSGQVATFRYLPTGAALSSEYCLLKLAIIRFSASLVVWVLVV